MRALSETFLEDLQTQEGNLHPILDRILKDHTLMLAIRNHYINVYYRGGNIARIVEKIPGKYAAFFDRKYNKSDQLIPELPDIIMNQSESNQWVQAFGILKNIMDEYFTLHAKPEREFQQLVARENNNSSISNLSEYFIADIELADSNLRSRFDMTGIRWLASERKNGNQCRVVLMEMKYGDGALGGSAGLLKHMQDLEALILNRTVYADLCLMIESQFQQLDQLGLMKYKHSTNGTSVKLDVNARPEVIFILANHNPRSKKLRQCLNIQEMDKYAQSGQFDLRFAVSHFSGYGLHSDCMLTLDEFRKKV